MFRAAIVDRDVQDQCFQVCFVDMPTPIQGQSTGDHLLSPVQDLTRPVDEQMDQQSLGVHRSY